jgi:hypothetical protein
MKTLMHVVALAVVAALATVACGATDGTENPTEQTEQAVYECIPIGGTCGGVGPIQLCCQTCPAGETASCTITNRLHEVHQCECH